jgi:catechol 2,3-dioxygenase-like lactoylglutathione lyase family enzyme
MLEQDAIMTFRLDHVVIAVANLAEASADYAALGFNVVQGGIHASDATHNALIYFQDGAYLELLAKTGREPRPGFPDYRTWLPEHEGLVGFCLLSDDLKRDVVAIRERGASIGEPQIGGRTRTDGTELRWFTSFCDGGIVPFFIQDETPRRLRVPPDATQQPNSITGIVALNIAAPSRSAEVVRLQQLFGIAPQNADDSIHDLAVFRLQGVDVTVSEDPKVTSSTPTTLVVQGTKQVHLPIDKVHGVSMRLEL